MTAASSERISLSEPATSQHPVRDHYERACDQAIAMCDGNLRSTIKALIMANEYLETELHELQMELQKAAASHGGFSLSAAGNAA